MNSSKSFVDLNVISLMVTRIVPGNVSAHILVASGKLYKVGQRENDRDSIVASDWLHRIPKRTRV